MKRKNPKRPKLVSIIFFLFHYEVVVMINSGLVKNRRLPILKTNCSDFGLLCKLVYQDCSWVQGTLASADLNSSVVDAAVTVTDRQFHSDSQ